MISPAESLSIDPSQMSPEERSRLAEALKMLKGETAWEDLLFRRTEAQLLDLAMSQVRTKRQRDPARREEYAAELAKLKAEKAALYERMSAAVARQKAGGLHG